MKSSFLILIFIALVHALPVYCHGNNVTAFDNVNVVTMAKEQVIENQTVLIVHDRIENIGSTERVDVLATAKIIEGNGYYLMPGLADMPTHFNISDTAFQSTLTQSCLT